MASSAAVAVATVPAALFVTRGVAGGTGFGHRVSRSTQIREHSEKTHMTDKNKICKLDAGTGEVIWESSLKSASARPLFLNDTRDVIYAVSSKTIYALKTQDGSLVWKRPPRLKGIVHQVQLTPQGLIVRGSPYVVYVNGKPQLQLRGQPFITLLDIATGQPLWNGPAPVGCARAGATVPVGWRVRRGWSRGHSAPRASAKPRSSSGSA